MKSRKLNDAKCLCYSLLLSSGLWLAGHALGEQSQGGSSATLTAEEQFALIQSCSNSDESDDQKLLQRCEAYQASMAAIMKSTLNRWIELETHKTHQRVHVAIPDQEHPFSLTNRRIYLREDYNGKVIMDPATQRKYPATVVHTLDLNCKDGETTLLALCVYDKDGKLEICKDVDQPKAQRILHFYQSPLRLVCSKEYLTPFVPNGEQLLAMEKAERARQLKMAVPDRSVAVPK